MFSIRVAHKVRFLCSFVVGGSTNGKFTCFVRFLSFLECKFNERREMMATGNSNGSRDRVRRAETSDNDETLTQTFAHSAVQWYGVYTQRRVAFIHDNVFFTSNGNNTNFVVVFYCINYVYMYWQKRARSHTMTKRTHTTAVTERDEHLQSIWREKMLLTQFCFSFPVSAAAAALSVI